MQSCKIEMVHKKTKSITVTAFLLASAIILAIVENTFPEMPGIAPGIRLGLSNIVIMYSLFFSGKSQAFIIAFLKSFFVFATKGMVAGFLSLFGGILSLVIMILLLFVFKKRVSYLILSIFGAVFHNTGQFIAISVIYTNLYIYAYLPVLLIAGVIAGTVTSTLLKVILPAFKRLNL